MTGGIASGAVPKLEQALAQWRHWRVQPRLPGAPHLLTALDGGSSNHNFLVEAAGRRFVVRVDRVNPAANGISRQAEWRVLQAAARRGIAPQARYFNPELGVLVCDYLTADAGATVTTAQLAALLRTLHDLPAIHYRMDPAERIRRYEHQLPRRWQGLKAFTPSLLDALDALEPGAPVVCHHDLSTANLLVSGGRLLALDWEYVAMGSRWFDLAVVVRDQQLAGSAVSELLSSYLGREPSDAECRTLAVHDLLSRHLELLWHATGQAGTPSRYPLEAQAAALANKLGVNPGSY
jgi:thiamine kinase-like enzyme